MTAWKRDGLFMGRASSTRESIRKDAATAAGAVPRDRRVSRARRASQRLPRDTGSPHGATSNPPGTPLATSRCSNIKEERQIAEQVSRTITVNGDPHRLYERWADLESFPDFMPGVKSV